MTANQGVFTVRLGCNLSTPCRGAFLLCLNDTLCVPGRTAQGGGGRLAGSDFRLNPHQVADVPVALTTLGRQFASLQGGFRSDVLADLLDYGIAPVASAPGFGSATAPSKATIELKSSEAGFTAPGGATMSCGGGVLVGPDTSCGFAAAVKAAYFRGAANGANADVRATSPVTRLTYTMHCVGDSPHVCTGGNDARVVWF